MWKITIVTKSDICAVSFDGGNVVDGNVGNGKGGNGNDGVVMKHNLLCNVHNVHNACSRCVDGNDDGDVGMLIVVMVVMMYECMIWTFVS